MSANEMTPFEHIAESTHIFGCEIHTAVNRAVSELIDAKCEVQRLRAESEAACSDAPDWAKTWRRAWRTLKNERSKNRIEQRRLHEQIEWLKDELEKARRDG